MGGGGRGRAITCRSGDGGDCGVKTGTLYSPSTRTAGPDESPSQQQTSFSDIFAPFVRRTTARPTTCSRSSNASACSNSNMRSYPTDRSEEHTHELQELMAHSQ